LAENIEKKYFIRNIFFPQTEENNTIYSRNVESNKWIGLILLRMFGNHGIKKIILQKSSRNCFISVNS
jgi:hypothetical protein